MYLILINYYIKHQLMKTKIISFIFLMTYTMTLVHCGVDAMEDFPHRPEPPTIAPPLEVEEPYEPNYIWSFDQREQIRQNTIGRYTGFINHQPATIVIRANNTVLMTVNNVETFYNYISFSWMNAIPQIIFGNENVYWINFVPGSRTQINGLISTKSESCYFSKKNKPDHEL